MLYENSSYVDGTNICNQYVFIWGFWQQLKILGQVITKTYYCLKLRNVFILCVGNYPKGKKTKHCSFIMRWAKPFEIPNVVVSSLNYVKDINCQEN
jgi:hypothetical protein